MKDKKETTSVLLTVPTAIYKKYIQILKERNLRRQGYSSQIFTETIQKEIDKYSS